MSLELGNFAGVDEDVVTCDPSVLEVAVHLIQLNILSGMDIQGIWKRVPFQTHVDENGTRIIATEESFEAIQAVYNEPETQEMIGRNTAALLGVAVEGQDEIEGSVED
jgi:hypothetical protein